MESAGCRVIIEIDVGLTTVSLYTDDSCANDLDTVSK